MTIIRMCNNNSGFRFRNFIMAGISNNIYRSKNMNTQPEESNPHTSSAVITNESENNQYKQVQYDNNA